MKKLGLICAAMLVSLSLVGCNNVASQEEQNNSRNSSSVKAVKHHKHHKKTEKKKSSTSSQAISSSRSTKGDSSQTSKATTRSFTSTENRPDHVVNDPNGAKNYSNETIRVGENGVTKYDWNGDANDPAQQSSATSAATSLNDANVVESN